MRNTVYKLIPVDFVDVDRFEGWAEDMARRGLYLHHLTPFLFAAFQRGEPAPVRYRLEPRGSFWSRESQNYCRSLGWEFVFHVGRWFDLYRNDDPEAPELHTDPVVHSYALDRISRSLRILTAVLVLCFVGELAALLLPYLLSETPVLLLLDVSGISTLSMLVLFLLLGVEFRSLGSFFRLRRRLREGIVPGRRSWRSSARWYFGLLLFDLVLLAALIASPLVLRSVEWEGELATAERPFPILELRELEGDPALEAVPSPITLEIFGYDSHNYVRRNWSLLAPGQYEVEQRLTGRGDYEPRLDMLWYRLSLPCLASPLLDDLISWYSDLRYAPEHYTVTEPELPGFDRAVLVQDNRWPGQELFLQAGNVVIYLDYSGAQDLTGRPELLARLAAIEA